MAIPLSYNIRSLRERWTSSVVAVLGIAGTVNRISGVHQEFLSAGGLGILIGDDQLPNPGLERIIEAYYSYALTPSTRLTFDYQFIANPAYNKDRGPVSVFGGRVHTQF